MSRRLPARLPPPRTQPSRRSLRRAPSDTRSSERQSLEDSWTAASDYQRIQELVLRLGLDALPERSSPLVSRLDTTADAVETPVPSAGHLRGSNLKSSLTPALEVRHDSRSALSSCLTLMILLTPSHVPFRRMVVPRQWRSC